MDKVLHFEIPADNLVRAGAFYQDVFGWGITDMPEMEYTMVETTEMDSETKRPKEPGAINGGMFKRTKDLTAPVITIGVDDIDASLKKVEAKGGIVLRQKTSVGGMGFSAYFKDTEGNVVGLWSMK